MRSMIIIFIIIIMDRYDYDDNFWLCGDMLFDGQKTSFQILCKKTPYTFDHIDCSQPEFLILLLKSTIVLLLIIIIIVNVHYYYSQWISMQRLQILIFCHLQCLQLELTYGMSWRSILEREVSSRCLLKTVFAVWWEQAPATSSDISIKAAAIFAICHTIDQRWCNNYVDNK